MDDEGAHLQYKSESSPRQRSVHRIKRGDDVADAFELVDPFDHVIEKRPQLPPPCVFQLSRRSYDGSFQALSASAVPD